MFTFKMERNPSCQKTWMSKLFSACSNSADCEFYKYWLLSQIKIHSRSVHFYATIWNNNKQEHVLGVWRTFTFKTVYETSNITIKICILTL